MAYTREAFKDVIDEHIGCALLEFYKIELATRNGLLRRAVGRIARIRSPLERGLVVTLLHDVHEFKDRRRPIEEVICIGRRELAAEFGCAGNESRHSTWEAERGHPSWVS